MAAAKVTDKAPEKVTEPPSADSVAAAFAKLNEAKKVEKRELSAAQRAKVMRQRLELAAKREGPKNKAKAIMLNAKDLGMSAEAYMAKFGSVIEASGL